MCRMHYTRAVISEIHRFAAVVPIIPPREVLKDTKFRNYLIPKVNLCLTLIILCEKLGNFERRLVFRAHL